MSIGLIWAAIALGCLALEVFTVDFVFASFACGAALAAITAFAGGDIELDVAAAALGSLASLIFIRPYAKRHLQTKPDFRAGANALAGAQAVVESPTTARLRGELWTLAEPLDPSIQVGDRVIVRGVVGASLDVAPQSSFYTDPSFRSDPS